MFKIITILKRKPGMSVEKFQEYWRHSHGPLMMKRPEVRRYIQSAALLQGYRKGELLFDGIGEVWLDSAEAFEAFLNGPGAAEMSSDEVNFLDRSRTVLMPVDVHVAKDGKIPEGAVKEHRVRHSADGNGVKCLPGLLAKRARPDSIEDSNALAV
jgi:uncharacterized protein (TIGR02118 family)